MDLVTWPGRYLGLALMVANWTWYKWGNRYERAVPGSLEQEHCRAKRRLWRWPGFLFIPMCLPNWMRIFVESFGHWYFFVGAILAVLMPFALRVDWRRFRREIEEDEDDWWNKAGRAGRRLAKRARAAAASLAAGPAAAPSPA